MALDRFHRAPPDKPDLVFSDPYRPVLVFLDVDGVLLPFGDAATSEQTDGSIFPDRCLAAFSELVGAFVNVRVVLSSTWRVKKSYRDQILDSLHCFGKAFGGPLETISFCDITDPAMHSTRQAEIAAWLQANDYTGAWIALDDEELVDGEENREHRRLFRSRVVKPASHVGLTLEDAHRAIFLLNKQLDSSSRRKSVNDSPQNSGVV